MRASWRPAYVTPSRKGQIRWLVRLRPNSRTVSEHCAARRLYPDFRSRHGRPSKVGSHCWQRVLSSVNFVVGKCRSGKLNRPESWDLSGRMPRECVARSDGESMVSGVFQRRYVRLKWPRERHRRLPPACLGIGARNVSRDLRGGSAAISTAARIAWRRKRMEVVRQFDRPYNCAFMCHRPERLD